MTTVDITQPPYSAVGDGVTANDTAFGDFTAWAVEQTEPIVLTIPAGTYAFDTPTTPLVTIGSQTPPFKVIQDLTVNGTGAILPSTWIAGFGIEQVGYPIETAQPNSRTINFVNDGDAAAFGVDANGNQTEWAMLTGLEMQSSSFPPNNYYFEFVRIQSINTSTNSVTLSGRVVNTYKSTWPSYNVYSSWFDGNATIYKLDPRWYCDIEYNGVTFTEPTQVNGNAYRLTLNNCSFSVGGLAPSEVYEFVANNTQLSASGAQVEFDKSVTTATLNNCTAGSFIIQSASVDSISVTGGQYESFVGTPKNITMDGVTVTGSFGICPVGYGLTDTVTLSDCSFGAIAYGRNIHDLSGFAFSNGVFSRANSSGPISWAIPGARSWFQMTIDPQYIYSSFLVTDVTQDATNTYIHTDLDALPNWSGILDAPDSMGAIGCTDVTATNCTGCDIALDLSNAPANSPVGIYAQRAIQGDITGNVLDAAVKVWGDFEEFRINVTQPYTGAQATCLYHIGGRNGAPVYDDDYVLSLWDAVINLKVAGERVITPSGATGLQSGDSVPSAAGLHFLGDINPWLNEDISADTAGQQPILEIEVTASQPGDLLPIETPPAINALVTKRIGGSAIAAIHRRVPEKPGPAVRH